MKDGWVRLWRKAWDEAPRPFNSWMAWVWMFSHAYFAGEDRGCVYASYKELADAWGWKKEAVRSQIRRWREDGNLPKLLINRDRSSTAVATGKSTKGPAAIRFCFVLTKFDNYNPPVDNATAVLFGKSTIPSTGVRPRLGPEDPHQVVADTGEIHPTESTPYEERKECIKSTVESDNSTPPVKPKKPKKTTDPRIKQLIDFFHDKHVEIHGEKPHIIGGRDASAIKRILNTVPDVEEIERRMVRYLHDPQGWMVGGPRWTISGFEKQLGKHAAASTRREKSPAELWKERMRRET